MSGPRTASGNRHAALGPGTIDRAPWPRWPDPYVFGPPLPVKPRERFEPWPKRVCPCGCAQNTREACWHCGQAGPLPPNRGECVL